METFKLARIVQIILVTIFVIVLGVIIIGTSLNAEATDTSAEGTEIWDETYVDDKGHTLIIKRDEHRHGYYCNICDCWVKRSNHIWKTIERIPNKDGKTHTTKDVCYGCQMMNNYIEDCNPSNWQPSKDNNKEHVKYCFGCKREMATGICLDSNGDSKCDECGRTMIITHTHVGATHENGGKCTVNGCGYQYETHQNSNIVCGYTDITETTHTKIYKCTQTGCDKTFKGVPENHNYINGKCACGKEKTESNEGIKIESGLYKIEDKYISNVKPNQVVNTVKTNIKVSGAEINIYNKDNKLIQGTTVVGTGARVEIKNEKETKNFIVIVKGDVNGDGKVDFTDLTTVNKARLNKIKLDEPYSLAADTIVDGKVDFNDIVKINRFRLNKIKEL